MTSIQEIAELVTGQLCFGPMPPLDSIHQPIQRIVPSCQHARKGDVVLWCGDIDKPNAHAECFLEEAFMRGAVGVIANRSVAPWPGCFCLQVDDPLEALSQIAERQSNRAIGKRILVVDPLVPSPAFHLLCQATNQTANGLELAVASDIIDSLHWQLIGLDTARTHTLIHTIELPNSNRQPCFLPDVIVFTSEWRKLLLSKVHRAPVDVHRAKIAELIRTAAGASIVCPDSWRDEHGLISDDVNATTYGQKQDATITGRWIPGESEGRTLGAINGKPVQLAPCWCGVADEALVAVATARVIGFDESEFVHNWLEEPVIVESDTGQRRAS